MKSIVRAFFLGAAWSALPSAVALGSPPTANQVEAAIAARRARVAEFTAIKEAAQELGIRVWLFGGTAAGFAHYVRWDLAREDGDTRYRESFFDYDFTNIYRSTQDADLVVDSTLEQAEELESLIKRKMSFLQGSKDHWEVRLLRHDRTVGGQVKQALLANPDFLGQNTDSNSTGMIELTDPPAGEGVVRDLRDWQSARPFFLIDVTEGRLHYHASSAHAETSRYRAGHNPPLFSVIRYLVKAFQYDLQIDGDDLREIQAVIDAFDPERDYASLSPWAKGWLERYGPNLIRHSVNIEYAWDTLEHLGLREKLVALSGRSREGSLGWWLAREPLRSRALGEGQGRTAAELGIDVVAHETRDFLAYESITRDTTLRPNVLISRPGYPGEMASYGPGFYARKGTRGARGTGFTVRFKVDPGAREGTDFTLHQDYLVFLNRRALRVIPESLNGTVLELFQMLLGADPSDRGVLAKLRRRLSLRPLAAEDEGAIVTLVRKELHSLLSKPRPSPLLEEWFSMPVSHSYPELVETFRVVISEVIMDAQQRRWEDRDDFLPLVSLWFTLSASRSHPELLVNLIQERLPTVWWSHPANDLVKGLLDDPVWRSHPEVVEALIRNGNFDLISAALEKPGWKDQLRLSLAAVQKMPASWLAENAIIECFGRWPSFWEHHEVLEALMERGGMFQWGVYDALTAKPPSPHPELILALIAWSDSHPLRAPRRAFSRDFWLDAVMRGGGWVGDPTLRGVCGGRTPALGCLRKAMRDRRSGPGLGRRVAEEAGARVAAQLAAATLSSHSGSDCRSEGR